MSLHTIKTLEVEDRLGVKLPLLFCTFLSEFSNGIFLLDSEPIGGISEESPCEAICKSHVILPDLPDKIHTRETDELIDSNHLISFNAVENSNDHWVFICEEGIPDNEYNEEPRLMQRSALAFFSVF